LLLVVAAAGTTEAADADPAAGARAARYYSEGLQAPLLQLRAGAQIVETCRRRFRAECSERHRLAAGKALHVLEYLDALTLFPERLDSDPAAALKTYEDEVEVLDDVNDSILRAAALYDRGLFARYEATLGECPPENLAAYEESLATLDQRDFEIFQVRALANSRYTELATTPKQSAQKIAAPGSPEDCVAARDLGELLMTMMKAKLTPWDRPANVQPDAEATRSIANEFLFEVATELETLVNPASSGKIRDIAARMSDGDPAPKKKDGLSLSW
jgi:hypothetical protein